MHIGSGKNAINNLEKIKRCDLHNNRKYKNNKNQEIDLSLSKYNITLVGTKNITTDIKEFYKKEFSEAVYNYNKNQKDERRKIVDYLEKMDKDSKSNIATEFIFQIGDKEDWENKNLEDKQKTVEIFKKAIPILEAKGIKTVNASIHIDETSPHLHLIAVPIIDNQKRGLKKQVSQNKVITKSVLNDIRTEVEKAFIEEYNKIYGTNKELKKGSEIPEHLQVQDYKDTKKVLEVAKKFAIKKIYIARSSLSNADFLEKLRKINTFIHVVKQGDKLPIFDHHLKVLSSASKNDHSIVLYGRFFRTRFLFASDLKEEGEAKLMQHYPKLKTDVLKVGQHGAKNSSHSKFLQQIEPAVALISVGKNNQSKQPSQDTIERFAQLPAKVYRTDEQGAVKFSGWTNWRLEMVK